jgi:group I intron endonuclease
MYYYHSFINRKISNRSSAIYSSILKHGYSNFSLDILEYCEPNVLIKREQYYIDLLKPEYNILKVAGSRTGFKHSEKTKAKMSINNTGEKNPMFGKIHTSETRKKIAESLKSIIRINNKPKVMGIETRLKLSLRSQGVCVRVFDKSNNLVNSFPTMTSAALYFGLSIRTIGRYLDKDTNYKGFVFKSYIKNT